MSPPGPQQLGQLGSLAIGRVLAGVVLHGGPALSDGRGREVLRDAEGPPRFLGGKRILRAFGKDYSGGTPIQLRVYTTRLLFWNEGQLPERWTVENLQRQHPSKPFNPDLANTLFRAGYIESWGRGTLSMLAECRAHQLPAPRFTFDATGCTVQFFADPATHSRSQGLREELIQLLLLAQRQGTVTNAAAQQLLGISKATATRYLRELVERRYLARTGTTGVGTSYSLIGA